MRNNTVECQEEETKAKTKSQPCVFPSPACGEVSSTCLEAFVSLIRQKIRCPEIGFSSPNNFRTKSSLRTLLSLVWQCNATRPKGLLCFGGTLSDQQANLIWSPKPKPNPKPKPMPNRNKSKSIYPIPWQMQIDVVIEN